MSKLILFLLLLFNINICEEPEKVRIFTKINNNEVNVRLGEEFAILLSYHSGGKNLYQFFNKNETQETLQYLGYHETKSFEQRHILGYRRNAFFHFKALKKTNKAVILKFTYGRFWKSSKDFTTFKINVK